MFNRIPRPVRPLIGKAFDEAALEKAFDDANVRQWFLQVQEPPYGFRRAHFYTTEQSSSKTIVTWRGWYQKKLSEQLKKDFGQAIAGLVPQDLTLENIARALDNAPQASMDILQRWQTKILQPELEKMEAILEGNIRLSDHFKYKIKETRRSLPYLDQSKASPNMWHAFVQRGVLQEVSFRNKDKSNFRF